MENLLEKHNQTLRQWKRFVSGLPVDNTIISETILDSWERASNLELDPYSKQIAHVLSNKKLAEVIDKNAELITTSMPFLDNLNNYLKDSGFFCSLCDSNGYIMKLLGDKTIVRNVKRGNFVPGACASEDTIGPNGIGTAMRLNRPVQVFSCEHYFISFHNYTCSGAPIHNHEGNIIGIINVTGPFLNANPHTLCMVVAAAHAIENLLHWKKASSECLIAENLQKTVIASIPEALISVDKKNVITLINKNAQRLFNLSPEMVIGKNICKVFGEKNKIFLKMVTNKTPVTDTEVRIYCNKTGSDYTMTSNIIACPEKNILGKVIILNEITRARTLVTKMIGAKANVDYDDIIGHNKNFIETLRLAKIASQSTSNVLLTGESGTGKDVFAQAIHNNSIRKNGPFVVINCAAIPRELISSELFGYEEGAFTGSKRGGNLGKFELSDKGTIFLDEIGEMPLELQTSLLRVIEEKAVTRIGGKRIRIIDVRVIAATNKNLKEEVAKGNFREDLFYRLNVFTIKLLPLRERKDDIPLLIDFFVKKISERMNKPDYKIHADFIEALKKYSCPGNVRELQNIIERAINIAPGNELTFELLPADISIDNTAPVIDQSQASSLEEMERLMMQKVIKLNLSKSEMAKKLKISRSTLYRKLEKYNIL